LYCLTRPPTPVTSTLSLPDALPISHWSDLTNSICEQRYSNLPNTASPAARVPSAPPTSCVVSFAAIAATTARSIASASSVWPRRSEEHTSELQSRGHLVCRLLLEKK